MPNYKEQETADLCYRYLLIYRSWIYRMKELCQALMPFDEFARIITELDISSAVARSERDSSSSDDDPSPTGSPGAASVTSVSEVRRRARRKAPRLFCYHADQLSWFDTDLSGEELTMRSVTSIYAFVHDAMPFEVRSMVPRTDSPDYGGLRGQVSNRMLESVCEHLASTSRSKFLALNKIYELQTTLSIASSNYATLMNVQVAGDASSDETLKRDLLLTQFKLQLDALEKPPVTHLPKIKEMQQTFTALARLSNQHILNYNCGSTLYHHLVKQLALLDGESAEPRLIRTSSRGKNCAVIETPYCFQFKNLPELLEAAYPSSLEHYVWNQAKKTYQAKFSPYLRELLKQALVAWKASDSDIAAEEVAALEENINLRSQLTKCHILLLNLDYRAERLTQRTAISKIDRINLLREELLTLCSLLLEISNKAMLASVAPEVKRRAALNVLLASNALSEARKVAKPTVATAVDVKSLPSPRPLEAGCLTSVASKTLAFLVEVEIPPCRISFDDDFSTATPDHSTPTRAQQDLLTHAEQVIVIIDKMNDKEGISKAHKALERLRILLSRAYFDTTCAITPTTFGRRAPRLGSSLPRPLAQRGSGRGRRRPTTPSVDELRKLKELELATAAHERRAAASVTPVR